MEEYEPGDGRPGGNRAKNSSEVVLGQRREKPCVLIRRPYRKPTQVDRCKGTKASERRVVKELGKLTP